MEQRDTRLQLFSQANGVAHAGLGFVGKVRGGENRFEFETGATATGLVILRRVMPCAFAFLVFMTIAFVIGILIDCRNASATNRGGWRTHMTILIHPGES